MARKTCVLFLIDSLVANGAERQLCELVKHMDHSRFEVHVVVHYDPGYHNGGELWPELADDPNVSLHSLHKKLGIAGYLTALPRLLALILRLRPDILHGYITGNYPVVLLGPLLRKRVVWGIRRTSLDQAQRPRTRFGSHDLYLWLARFTDLVIFNSEAGKRNHQAMGMKAPRMMVVPNGFDVARFAPDAAAGAAQRQEWGVPAEVPLIGIVGRLNPVKDHPTFLRAAARIAQASPEARFVCIGGDGTVDYQVHLQSLARDLGLEGRVLWPGVCLSMPAAYNALSVLVLSSLDEGFPNVVGEAMACGVPCVATRAGDAALLVGDTGYVAAVGDDVALAAGVLALLEESPEARKRRSEAVRTRICATYSVEALARATEAALLALLGRE
jgi:glycosyltransferase involved in cell wall biosynthesis